MNTLTSKIRTDNVAGILNPVRGIRDEQARKGIKPKNHHRDNVDRLKDLERQNAARAEMESQKKELFKLSRFKSVESKVATTIHSESAAGSSSSSSNADTKSREFLRRKTPSFNVDESLTNPPEPTRKHQTTKPALPKREELPLTSTESSSTNKNFVAENYRTLANAKPNTEPPPQSLKQKALERPAETIGKVPDYLVQRKDEWKREQEERARNAPDPDVPAGMMVMPDEERKEMLATLYARKEVLDGQLRALPIMCDTMGLRKKKSTLEAQLTEVEGAIRVFTPARVYIAK